MSRVQVIDSRGENSPRKWQKCWFPNQHPWKMLKFKKIWKFREI